MACRSNEMSSLYALMDNLVQDLHHFETSINAEYEPSRFAATVKAAEEPTEAAAFQVDVRLHGNLRKQDSAEDSNRYALVLHHPSCSTIVWSSVA